MSYAKGPFPGPRHSTLRNCGRETENSSALQNVSLSRQDPMKSPAGWSLAVNTPPRSSSLRAIIGASAAMSLAPLTSRRRRPKISQHLFEPVDGTEVGTRRRSTCIGKHVLADRRFRPVQEHEGAVGEIPVVATRNGINDYFELPSNAKSQWHTPNMSVETFVSAISTPPRVPTPVRIDATKVSLAPMPLSALQVPNMGPLETVGFKLQSSLQSSLSQTDFSAFVTSRLERRSRMVNARRPTTWSTCRRRNATNNFFPPNITHLSQDEIVDRTIKRWTHGKTSEEAMALVVDSETRRVASMLVSVTSRHDSGSGAISNGYSRRYFCSNSECS